MPNSHYTRYVQRLEVLLGSPTAFMEVSYLLRFGVSITRTYRPQKVVVGQGGISPNAYNHGLYRLWCEWGLEKCRLINTNFDGFDLLFKPASSRVNFACLMKVNLTYFRLKH